MEKYWSTNKPEAQLTSQRNFGVESRKWHSFGYHWWRVLETNFLFFRRVAVTTQSALFQETCGLYQSIGSGPRYMICVTHFGTLRESKKPRPRENRTCFACDSRMAVCLKRVQFSHGREFFDSRTCRNVRQNLSPQTTAAMEFSEVFFFLCLVGLIKLLSTKTWGSVRVRLSPILPWG